jgi:hypothetical protein
LKVTPRCEPFDVEPSPLPEKVSSGDDLGGEGVDEHRANEVDLRGKPVQGREGLPVGKRFRVLEDLIGGGVQVHSESLGTEKSDDDVPLRNVSRLKGSDRRVKYAVDSWGAPENIGPGTPARYVKYPRTWPMPVPGFNGVLPTNCHATCAGGTSLVLSAPIAGRTSTATTAASRPTRRLIGPPLC